jgi:hypothetical protein
VDNSKLTPVEQIEYYLGKDRLPNIHWRPELPNLNDIPPRINFPVRHNETFMLDGISHTVNNLGYRANYDYNLNELKTKKIVLLLGDSDTFGRGVEFLDLYSTKMQNKSEYHILNMGVPGTSNDGMARIGVKTILALTPAIAHVCVLWPMQSLREFVSKTFKSGIHNLVDTVPYDNWWDHIDWVSNNYNYQKNRLLLEQTTANAGAEFHDLMINRYDKNSTVTYNSFQNNEITELTPDSHTAIAEYFLRKINHQPSLYQTMQS